MEYMKHSFLTEDRNDDHVHPSCVSVDDKLAVATKMADASKRALAILQTTPLHDARTEVEKVDDMYFIWLFVKRGDLEGREDREGYTMDGAQRNQVRDYIKEVFGTLITEDEVNSEAFVFDNLWKFFQVHDSNLYRKFSHPCNAPLQPQLDELWHEHDTNKSACQDLINARTLEFSDCFEDFYFVRGLLIAKADVQNIKKCVSSPYTKKTYNVARGFERFQKLLKNHGPRPALLEQKDLFERLVVQYVPLWVLDNDARLQADSTAATSSSNPTAKPLPPWIRERILESISIGKEYIVKIQEYKLFDVTVDRDVFARAQEVLEKYSS